MKQLVASCFQFLSFYCRVIKLIVKNNLASQFQYRTSIIIRFFGTFAELLLTLAFFKFLYDRIGIIGDWDYPKILILACLFDIIRNILLGCFIKNLPKLEDIIINGKLDILLTKPIDPQFYVSFQQVSIGHFLQIIIPISIFCYVLGSYPNIHTSLGNVVILLLNTIFGIIIGYSLWIFVMSFTFYVVKIKSLHEIFLNLIQLGKYPSSIYGNNIKLFFKYIFPILMIASYPSEIFLGFSSAYGSYIMLIISLLSFIIARYLWNRALTKYESAGG